MSVSSSFQRLISRIDPSASELASAAQHANTIKTRLKASFRLKKLMVIGSYSRKTHIGGSSDIDVFAVLARDEMRWGGNYVNPATALDNLRKDLEARYPYTTIYKDVHAIVVDFSGTRCCSWILLWDDVAELASLFNAQWCRWMDGDLSRTPQRIYQTKGRRQWRKASALSSVDEVLA
jgi:predicted nucleotidyltransferase